ncbi:EAL domain-containing protein [Photobacterium sp. SDRW27]|uniref:EAL domain-containing protein n=1 Tax=Photobacterium obscurum TaxID=2829490 RepID=UPI0022440A23|nr:EAL domain-containing protein [Photobacterium obscurum]MCW8327799.1 EAL domain-containing protein [Photobacterium obscurum]
MNKSHTVTILIATFVIGLIIDVILVKHQAKQESEKTVTHLITSMTETLSKIERKLILANQSHVPCSIESKQVLESIVFGSSVIQEISYIEDFRFICSDRDNKTNTAINEEHAKFIKNASDYVIYRANSQRRNIEGLFFMIPVNNGWYRILLDSRYMDFWLTELTAHHNLYGCLLDSRNSELYRCNSHKDDQIAFSVTLTSEKFPITATVGYTEQMLLQVMLDQLPYATLVILILSGLVLLIIHAISNWRHSLLSDIQRGIKNKEFYAFYQPIVCSKSGKWQGAELLARWFPPHSDIISPAEFIPAAEQSGLINDITLLLLERAAFEKEMINSVSPDSYISINVTASMIANPSYVTALIEVIAKYPSLQSNIVLEFTEREAFSNTELSVLQSGMQRLREVGIRWALDDFGTGYAGLSTLQALRFDILKIDRTFVASSVTGAVTHSILGNIAEIGHKLQCSLVAEGVETKEQADHVAQLGIQLSQGFYFDKPMSFDDYLSNLERIQSPISTFLQDAGFKMTSVSSTHGECAEE